VHERTRLAAACILFGFLASNQFQLLQETVQERVDSDSGALMLVLILVGIFEQPGTLKK